MNIVEIRKTELFAKWIDNLRDVQAKARVLVMIERLASGNAGDVMKVYRKCGSTTAPVTGCTS
jgi:putative addiction module killer protein